MGVSVVLSELEKRRPGIDLTDTIPIVLADGQEWCFPKPFVDFIPRFDDGRCVLAVESEYQAFLDRMDTDDSMEQLKAECELERHMLLKVYDLSDEEIAGLLRWRSSSEADTERRQAILNVAWGVGPKPKPDGGS